MVCNDILWALSTCRRFGSQKKTPKKNTDRNAILENGYLKTVLAGVFSLFLYFSFSVLNFSCNGCIFHLCVCVCLRARARMCVCVCVCVWCVRVCMCLCVFVCVSLSVCICVYVRVCVSLCVSARACRYVCAKPNGENGNKQQIIFVRLLLLFCTHLAVTVWPTARAAVNNCQILTTPVCVLPRTQRGTLNCPEITTHTQSAGVCVPI